MNFLFLKMKIHTLFLLRALSLAELILFPNGVNVVYRVHGCTSSLRGSFVTLNCSNSFQMTWSALSRLKNFYESFHQDALISLKPACFNTRRALFLSSWFKNSPSSIWFLESLRLRMKGSLGDLESVIER